MGSLLHSYIKTNSRPEEYYLKIGQSELNGSADPIGLLRRLISLDSLRPPSGADDPGMHVIAIVTNGAS